jgi:hypothetical protein
MGATNRAASPITPSHVVQPSYTGSGIVSTAWQPAAGEIAVKVTKTPNPEK